jgi:hypothetical protein
VWWSNEKTRSQSTRIEGVCTVLKLSVRDEVTSRTQRLYHTYSSFFDVSSPLILYPCSEMDVTTWLPEFPTLSSQLYFTPQTCSSASFKKIPRERSLNSVMRAWISSLRTSSMCSQVVAPTSSRRPLSSSIMVEKACFAAMVKAGSF